VVPAEIAGGSHRHGVFCHICDEGFAPRKQGMVQKGKHSICWMPTSLKEESFLQDDSRYLNQLLPFVLPLKHSNERPRRILYAPDNVLPVL
jgi:hypothetical protein